MIKNFFPNKTALYALVAACFVVCTTMGVRATFGLYSSEFESSAGTSNTEIWISDRRPRNILGNFYFSFWQDFR